MQVAESVGAPGADEGEIGRQRVFQHIGASVDFPVFLALGQLGADAGGSVKGADAGGGGAHPFRQRTLRHQLGVQLAVVVHPHEGRNLRRMRGRGKGADHLFDLAGLNKRTDIYPFIQAAGVVGDAGQVFDAQPMDGGQQVPSQADIAEAGRHKSHTVLHIGDGGIKIVIDLVFHWDGLLSLAGRRYGPG